VPFQQWDLPIAIVRVRNRILNLARQANTNPIAFMSLLGRVLPLQVTGDTTAPVSFVIMGTPVAASAEEWERNANELEAVA
jgi:hypothetical protein